MNWTMETFENDVLLDRALHELQAIPDDRFDLLENPFEKKLVLSDMERLPEALEAVVIALETRWQDWAKVAFRQALWTDSSRNYCSIFKYLPSGFLSCHVDAGIHPLNQLRKHVTTILYLGEVDEGGELEMWAGESAEFDMPRVTKLLETIEPEHGKLIQFECNNFAWHAVRECLGEKPRYAITVSDLSQAVDRWHKRQRAYFVPRPHEVWDEGTFKLRDLRSDPERFAEVYRT